MKLLLLLALLALPVWAGQSIVLNAGAQGTNASVPAQTGDCRIEFALQDWTNPITVNTNLFTNTACGVNISYAAGNLGTGALYIYWLRGNAGTGPCVGNGFEIPLAALATKFIYVRYQQSVAGSTYLAALTNQLEAWDVSGTRIYPGAAGTNFPNDNGTCTYTMLGGSNSNGATVGDSTSVISSTVAFARIYSNNVPVNGQPPTTAADLSPYSVGCVFHWKFDNSAADACGSLTATLSGSTSYVTTGTSQNLVVARPQTLVHPVFADWRTMKVGASNQYDGTQSYSQADASSICSTYLWAHISGPTTLTYDNTALAQPTVTNVARGGYVERLTCTDVVANTDSTDLTLGAASYDANGVILHASQQATDFWGPQIAFGFNKWEYEDQQNYKMIGFQNTYQQTRAANDNWNWTTPGTGTISYVFGGRGVAPGITGTTLTAGITSTATSIAIADASKIPGLASLPTWILIGNDYGATEMVRITATTATSGAATLTVAYDGRGLSGNNTALGGWATTTAAASHAMGDIVGEFRLYGTSTLFQTDMNRPLAPAGGGTGAAPPGPVVYSTGTVTFTPGSTTVACSGCAWTDDNIGSDNYGKGWLYVMGATHDGGTAFPFWRQIVSRTDATHLVLDHPAPTGIDGTAFAYKITSHALYLSLEFAMPTYFNVSRGLWNIVGCESETACFAIVTHDVPALDTVVMGSGGAGGSNLKYSYKTLPANELSSNGTGDPNFYGTALAGASFYERSGYGPASDLANYINDHWASDPEVANGLFVGSPLAWGGGALATVADIMFNPSTTNTWEAFYRFAVRGEIGAQSCNDNDTRSAGYMTAALTVAANWDTDATRRAAYKTALGSVLTQDQGCLRTAADGYTGSEVNSFANAFIFNPAGSSSPNSLTLTSGSTAVTGTGFTNGSAGAAGYCYGVDIITLTVTNSSSMATVASGTLTQQTMIWFADGATPKKVGVFEYLGAGGAGTVIQLSGVWTGQSGTFSAMSTLGGIIASGGQVIGGYGSIWTGNTDSLANNQALEKAWACKFNSSTSLTLFRPWDAANGSSYKISYYNIGAFGVQPFMSGGIKADQIGWASVNDDPTISAGYATIAPLLGAWQNTYGYDSTNTKGLFYDQVYQACGAPTDVPAGMFYSIHGFQGCGSGGLLDGSAATARVNSVEGGRAMLDYYRAQCLLGTSQCDAARTVVDTFYGAIFGYVPLCDASVLSTCDGTIASNYTDANLSSTKWPGFFFGVGGFFSSTWPALRESAASGAPTLSSVVPPVGNLGRTVAVTLTGTNFVNGGSAINATCNSCSLPVISVTGTTFVSSTSLTANFVIGNAVTGLGTYNITVTTSAGISGAQTFTVVGAPTGGNRLSSSQRTSGSARN